MNRFTLLYALLMNVIVVLTARAIHGHSQPSGLITYRDSINILTKIKQDVKRSKDFRLTNERIQRISKALQAQGEVK